ncbi:MAG: hypothetical protein WC383_12280 [Gammaproteobacteria bacterium]|jgi:hypothetical protein
MKASRTKIIFAIYCIILLTFVACSTKFSGLKTQQFDILKQNVTKTLGEDYQVKKIEVINEGYTNEEKNYYVVEFAFSLNRPFLLLPSSNLPGKLVFSKDASGEWECTFNSGNPSELLNLFR